MRISEIEESNSESVCSTGGTDSTLVYILGSFGQLLLCFFIGGAYVLLEGCQ